MENKTNLKHTTMQINATLKEKCRQSGGNLYICTFRGKPIHVAGKQLKFECANNVTFNDITEKFLRVDELARLEIIKDYKK